MSRKAWIFILGGLIGGAFYLLLIDSRSLPELYVLAGVALVCAVAFSLAREEGFAEASIRPWWLGGLWRLALKIPADIVLVCAQALAQLLRPRKARGTFRTASFEAVKDTPPDTGRRSLTEWFGSVAPNTIVVGVDAERKLLLVHQLQRQGTPSELDVLRLG